MPGGDRTGPAGAGPMTGRAAGYCRGGAQPGYASSFFPRGRRFPGVFRGRGFGMRQRFFGNDPLYYHRTHKPLGSAEEAEFLRNQAQNLREDLADIDARISELENQKTQQDS
ncbi:MAG: DUF5320 domain-containing protein [Spirochaetales bacterium]|nr:DUF5320 domain-containing protein [Spirochaetales bacterium]